MAKEACTCRMPAMVRLGKMESTHESIKTYHIDAVSAKAGGTDASSVNSEGCTPTSQLARYSYSNHIHVIPIPSQCKCPHLIGLGRLHNTIVIDIGSHSVLIAYVNNHGIGVLFHLP